MYENLMMLIYYVGFGISLLSLIALAKVFVESGFKWDLWIYIPFVILWIIITSACINCMVKIAHG